MEGLNKFREINEKYIDIFNGDWKDPKSYKRGDRYKEAYIFDVEGGPNQTPDWKGSLKIVANNINQFRLMKETRLKPKDLDKIFRNSNWENNYEEIIDLKNLPQTDDEWDKLFTEMTGWGNTLLVIADLGGGDYYIGEVGEILVPADEKYSVIMNLEGYADHVFSDDLSKQDAEKLLRDVNNKATFQIVKGNQLQGKRVGVTSKK